MAHACNGCCMRPVFGNLFQCVVTGEEHLCDRCVRFRRSARRRRRRRRRRQVPDFGALFKRLSLLCSAGTVAHADPLPLVEPRAHSVAAGLRPGRPWLAGGALEPIIRPFTVFSRAVPLFRLLTLPHTPQPQARTLARQASAAVAELQQRLVGRRPVKPVPSQPLQPHSWAEAQRSQRAMSQL